MIPGDLGLEIVRVEDDTDYPPIRSRRGRDRAGRPCLLVRRRDLPAIAQAARRVLRGEMY